MSFLSQEHIYFDAAVQELDVNAYSQEFKDWLNSSNILHKESDRYTSDGTFDSMHWIFLDENTQYYRCLNFKSKQDNLLIKKSTTGEDLLLIKCWLTDALRNNLNISTLIRMFESIYHVIEKTNNFDLDSMDNECGNIRKSIKHESINVLYYVRDYIYFLDSLDLTHSGHSTFINIVGIDSETDLKKDSNTRKLPQSKDILLFQYYLNRFFEDETDEDLLNFYKPLLLWWKLTTVIPMRPSEFSFKLKRDCLSFENNSYFIDIDRVKVIQSDTSRNEGRIPIIKRLKITKEIYDLISDYINSTSFDKYSKTLISYNALLHFRKNYISKNKSNDNAINLRHNCRRKKFDDSFNLGTLDTLLDSFYDLIIEDRYNESDVKQRLNPGDTRHIAFTSLVLQGVSPIEIAMMGGHTTLESQNSYTGHVEFYIDSEILTYIGNKNIDKFMTDKRLKDIIFAKPYTPPKFLADCYPSEDNIGYCTLDMNTSLEVCDNVEFCIFCSKWWCEPKNENYIKARKFLLDKSIGPLSATIKEEEKFLNKLFTDTKVINIDGLLEIDKDADEAIKHSVIKLRGNIDKLIFYKASLLESLNDNQPKVVD